MAPRPDKPPTNPEDETEDGTPNPEDIPRNRRRRYNLSEAGRERLSELGRSRWASGTDTDQREAEIEERERRVDQALQVPADERLREVIQRETETLPVVAEGGLVRDSGKDYRLTSRDGLVHVYWPKGEKLQLEPGAWFSFGGRPYRVREGRLERVSPSTVLARVLDREG